MVPTLYNEEKTASELRPCIHFGTGALGGFYQLGITKFLAENYDLKDIDFSGTSAGSMCATILAFECNPKCIDSVVEEYITTMENYTDREFWRNTHSQIIKSTKKLNTKKKIKKNKLHIISTELTPIPKRVIITNLTNFTQAMEACVASSYIPFLCGTAATWYNGTYMCDGGLLGDRDMPANRFPLMKIHPDFWGREIKDIYSWNSTRALELYKQGYQDSYVNKRVLDYILNNKDKSPFIVNNPPKTYESEYAEEAPSSNN
tara:strand:- start:507 stop:1289 length:783 start_codon:yes stop_codon:yes gene_type:complete